MTDAPTATSLAALAKQLTALSRAKTDDEKDTQDQGQVETALTKLNAELAELANVLAAHRRLSEVGVPIEAFPDLDKPAIRLRTQVEEVGRPTAQYLTARTKDVTTARTAIADSDRSAWREWADRAIGHLRTGLIPLLNVAQRQQVATRVTELKKTAALTVVRSSDVTLFTSSLHAVNEALAAVGETDLDGLLAKFDNGRVLLADLTDAELQMLREDGSLSEQLYLVLS